MTPSLPYLCISTALPLWRHVPAPGGSGQGSSGCVVLETEPPPPAVAVTLKLFSLLVSRFGEQGRKCSTMFCCYGRLLTLSLLFLSAKSDAQPSDVIESFILKKRSVGADALAKVFTLRSATEQTQSEAD